MGDRIVTGKFFKLLLLTFALALAGCDQNPRHSSVSVNGLFLLKTWRCEEPEERAVAEFNKEANRPATVAEKLLQCPFYRDYQIEAMQRDSSVVVEYDQLYEIVYKIRWGIDHQYTEYEHYLLNNGSKRFSVPRILNRVVPGFSDVLQLGIDLADQPMEFGKAAPMIARQMQRDRVVTGAVIDKRLVAFKRSKRAYPLWQAMIDLDAYFTAGTGLNAMASLEAESAAVSRAY